MKDILADLSPVQQEAVKCIDGPSLIIAGAGSGKTRVLTYKIAYLLMNNVPPKSVLALTFTNKAAREMKERIAKVVGKQANKLWMGTFHSIFSRILRAEAEAIGFTPNFTIYDTTDSLSILKSIIKEMDLNDKIYKDREVFGRISMAKNCLMTPASYTSSIMLTEEDIKSHRPKISGIYQRYVMKCRNANALDFDDLLLYTNILFRDYPEILKKYQQWFKYILVDEYQDTNVAQYLIVKRLAEIYGNITVVGDDAQSIYSFRGAKIENILNFRKDYPNYSEFKLEQNYRSTKVIVNAANSLIAKNKKQLKKVCFSEGEVGEKIEIIRAFTDQEEGQLVASSIVDTVYCKQVNYSDIAILYRTNAQSRIFEDSLRRRNIAYKIYGGISFYQRAEIKDVLAYMRLTVNTQDNEAMSRIINYPVRGIGSNTMDKLQSYSSSNNISLWEVINRVLSSRLISTQLNLKESTLKRLADFKEMIESFIQKVNTEDAYTFAMNVVKRAGIMTDLQLNKTPDGVSRIENIEELLHGIKEYAKISESKEKGVMIVEYLQNVSLITDMDSNTAKDHNKVTLMTIHSAKGLEFNYVYIVGMEEGLFPGPNSIQSENLLEEERRLFYVALTRAAVKVTISFAQTRCRWGNMISSAPSRFLHDIDSAYLSVNYLEPYDKFDTKERTPLRLPYKKLDKPKITDGSSKQKKKYRQEEVIDISALPIGTEVEHARFGRGRVVEVEIEGKEARARVDFYNAGIRTLILKFAQLYIVNDDDNNNDEQDS
ncbi:MAG: UvrD-helicase domain-containing protein [Prevotellaceae bacterium]|jgi:DNA helicase-2/ATP-dependent DNA helicase PcrA|nr:UvrD-helicase domain-containing protein [Prevotellaceae bacterium]